MSTLPKTSGETMKLATFFSALEYEDLPESSHRAVRHFVLDTVACALHGLSLIHISEPTRPY